MTGADFEAVMEADRLAREIGYGSQVLGPLDDALRQVRYALATARGEN